MRAATRRTFRVRCFCGHGETRSLPDGPGFAAEAAKAQAAARWAWCETCAAAQARRRRELVEA
ncbi:MAG: hypothetical protein ACYC6A_00650 [Armatimonadota bacterium]